MNSNELTNHEVSLLFAVRSITVKKRKKKEEKKKKKRPTILDNIKPAHLGMQHQIFKNTGFHVAENRQTREQN